MSEIAYDLESFKKLLDFFEIEYKEKWDSIINDFVLPDIKNNVLVYCNRDNEDKEKEALDFTPELKLIALQIAVRRFLLDLINSGQYKRSDDEGDKKSEEQSVKIGDTMVTFGESEQRSTKEIIESFQKQLEKELENLYIRLQKHRLYRPDKKVCKEYFPGGSRWIFPE